MQAHGVFKSDGFQTDPLPQAAAEASPFIVLYKSSRAVRRFLPADAPDCERMPGSEGASNRARAGSTSGRRAVLPRVIGDRATGLS